MILRVEARSMVLEMNRRLAWPRFTMGTLLCAVPGGYQNWHQILVLKISMCH